MKKNFYVDELASFGVVQDEFSNYANVKEMGVKEIADMLLDSEVEVNSIAEGFLLRELKIPAGYFHAVNSNHKKEIMDNAVFSYPDFEARVLIKEDRLVAAGPILPFDFIDFLPWLKERIESVLNVSGDLDKSSLMRVFSPVHKYEIGNDIYYLGLDVEITPLFCNGVRMLPMVTQLVCLNGLLQLVETPAEMKIKSIDVSFPNLEIAVGAVDGALKGSQNYFNLISKAEEISAKSLLEFKRDVEDYKFPKSFVEKTTNLMGRVLDKEQLSDPVPAEIKSLRDQVSFMTYSAQQFAERTRLNIEALSYKWLKDRVV